MALSDREQAQLDMTNELRRQKQDPFGTGQQQRLQEKLDAQRRAINEANRRRNGL